ncbi:MAG: sensor histidine kinase, partial [Peptostreptococcaceae bacterium]
MINIFKDIIDVNEILYLDVKISENDKKYEININDYSRYFKEKQLIKEENQLIDLVEDILSIKGELKVNDFKNIKQFENNRYLKTINSYCDINIYDKLNNEYYIVISINERMNNDLNSCDDLDQIDDYIANIAHELRTPINIISSASQVLTQKLDNIDCEKKHYFIQYTNIIDKNISRMVKLVNTLIDTTKIEEGMFEHNPKNEDIVKFVEDTCLSIDEFAKYNKTKIIFDTNIEEQIIAFDPESMERVLLNLLSNAIKFNNSKENIYVTMNCNENIQI